MEKFRVTGVQFSHTILRDRDSGSAAPQDPPRSTDNMMEWVSKRSHAEISMKAVNCLSPASHARPSGISSGQTICSVLKLASMEYLLKSGKWEL